MYSTPGSEVVITGGCAIMRGSVNLKPQRGIEQIALQALLVVKGLVPGHHAVRSPPEVCALLT
ncbi:hypothetical protein FKM82_013324 [Ascaphus truei]